MINQMVQVSLGNMICNFGKGDIAVGVAGIPCEPDKVAITFQNIKKNQEIGSDVDQENCGGVPIVMMFDNIESLNVVKTSVEKAIAVLSEKLAVQAVPEKPEFIVPYKNVKATGAFKASNPAAAKVLDCMKHFQETGEIDRDIIVSENLVIQDGYVGYLVAGYNNMKKIKVVAKDGIKINLGKIITFKSDKIAISYGMIGGSGEENGAFYLVINTCGTRYEIPAETVEDAVAILKKIENVFEGHYSIYHTSTMNVAMYTAMKEAGMDVKIIQK